MNLLLPTAEDVAIAQRAVTAATTAHERAADARACGGRLVTFSTWADWSVATDRWLRHWGPFGEYTTAMMAPHDEGVLVGEDGRVTRAGG